MKKFIRKHPFRMLIALLLLIVSSLDNIIIAEAFKQLYQVVENKNTDLLLPVFLKMVTLYGMVSIAEFSFNVCQAKLIEIYNVEKKDELYRSSLLKNNLWNNTDTGEFLSLMTNDMKFLEGNYFKVLFQITKMVFYVSFSIIYAFYLDFYLALIFIICSIVSAVVPKIFGNKIRSASSSWTKHNSVYTNQLKESALGKETIIGYGVEEISIANVKRVNQGMEESLKKMSIIVAFSNSSVGFIATIGFLFPELIGVYWVVIEKLSLGVLLALM
ncbi:ABC transporter transmembrane domain-containing protein, partial [Bacillus pacificus]|nr:ABC transporter transmembrane domain-containing protein [Bacillus pacificus]